MIRTGPCQGGFDAMSYETLERNRIHWPHSPPEVRTRDRYGMGGQEIRYGLHPTSKPLCFGKNCLGE